MKPDEHLHITAELTTADHQTALKLLRGMAEWIDHHATHPDKPINADWSEVNGSAAITIKTRKDHDAKPTEPERTRAERETDTDMKRIELDEVVKDWKV